MNALHRREAGQNSPATHDRFYVLADHRVQNRAAEVIAADAEDAARRATACVVAPLRATGDPADRPTVVADCQDDRHGPVAGVDGRCAASFLMCLGCANARIHPGHHARLALLHRALGNLRSVLSVPVWESEWAQAHARLEDLRATLGDGLWRQALHAVGDEDRALVVLLLAGVLEG
ncbi:hypothetical protein AB0N81_22700 [Streptomyces sp. NPDC093510]|uniref:hypothetical protein n=1 Tax=Streptomyces sp. NPDC093510 TaxID=3155199 RepID=UPI00344A03DD